MLGQGTFGQVVKCSIPETDHFVAVKVIKNQPAYYRQGMAEVSILSLVHENMKYIEVNFIMCLCLLYKTFHMWLTLIIYLLQLNNNFDLGDNHHIVRMLDYFIFRNHLCIAFEMLGPNL